MVGMDRPPPADAPETGVARTPAQCGPARGKAQFFDLIGGDVPGQSAGLESMRHARVFDRGSEQGEQSDADDGEGDQDFKQRECALSRHPHVEA
jgi:hypothetical protein